MTQDIMNKIAVRARQMILDNVTKGIDIDGKRYGYSETPFARPYDPKLKGVKGLVKEGRLMLFLKGKQRFWMVVKKGYKDYRRMKGQNPDGDFLQVSGAMLRNLQITELTDTSFTLGFTDAVQLKKALWFNVMGVGKSKKLWKFLGLRKEQETELAEYAASLMTEKFLEQLLKGKIT